MKLRAWLGPDSSDLRPLREQDKLVSPQTHSFPMGSGFTCSSQRKEKEASNQEDRSLLNDIPRSPSQSALALGEVFQSQMHTPVECDSRIN